MAVINPHQETHPTNQNPPSNDNSPGHPANQQSMDSHLKCNSWLWKTSAGVR